MIGERIRKLRLERDLAQIHLADMLGISKKTIDSWETGKREPRIVDLVHLADIFKVTLDELVGRDAEPS